jgi:hypothetical protein
MVKLTMTMVVIKCLLGNVESRNLMLRIGRGVNAVIVFPPRFQTCHDELIR